jgi:hypothetical protein
MCLYCLCKTQSSISHPLASLKASAEKVMSDDPPPPRWFHICSAERTLTPQIPLHEQNKLSVNRARIQLALWIAANRK